MEVFDIHLPKTGLSLLDPVISVLDCFGNQLFDLKQHLMPCLIRTLLEVPLQVRIAFQVHEHKLTAVID